MSSIELKRQALVVPNPITEVSEPGSGKYVSGGGRREKKIAKIWLLKKMVINQKKRNEALIVQTKCCFKVIDSNPTTLPNTEILKVSNFELVIRIPFCNFVQIGVTLPEVRETGALRVTTAKSFFKVSSSKLGWIATPWIFLLMPCLWSLVEYSSNTMSTWGNQ